MFKQLNDSDLKKIFFTIICIHALTWIILPTLLRHAVTHDTIEAIVWSNQWQWGYDKNPWFVALATKLGVWLGGRTGFGIYFIQQVFIVTAFWAIWQLTLKLSNIRYAFLVSLIFEATTVFILNPQLNNDNYILTGLWPLSALLFYYACYQNKIWGWVGASIALGLATMAKYDTAIVVAAYGLFLIYDKNLRRHFLSWPLYLAIIIYIAIVTPNLIWLAQHHFLTLNYAFVERGTAGALIWRNIFITNLQFILNILGDFLPAFLLLLVGIEWKKNFRNQDITTEAKPYIFWVGLMPFILLLLVGFIGKITLLHEWGLNFITLWGAVLLFYCRPLVSTRSIKRFLMVIIALLIAWPIGFIIVATQFQSSPWSSNYPAPEVANSVTQLWHQRYHSPLEYVAGDRFLAGYVSFYSKDRPQVFMEWNPDISTWINLNNLRCKGAIFIQDDYRSYVGDSRVHFPNFVVKEYPNLIILPAKEFGFYRTGLNNKKIHLLVGVLPPGNC